MPPSLQNREGCQQIIPQPLQEGEEQGHQGQDAQRAGDDGQKIDCAGCHQKRIAMPSERPGSSRLRKLFALRIRLVCNGLEKKLLVLLLLFFILVFYVNPIYKMLAALNNYRSFGKGYIYEFDGDDQLVQLNNGIKEIAAENIQLRKRIKGLRDTLSQHGES